MTQTMSKDGKPIFFPASYAMNETGVIVAPPRDALPAIAAAVAARDLALFTKRLVDAARKHRFRPHYRAVNRRRLQLAALCIERWLEEELDAAFERLDREEAERRAEQREAS